MPVIPLFDVVGSGNWMSPEQIGAIAVNVGRMFGLTMIVMVVVRAHSPDVGVNVYVVVSVLFKAGDQVPVMPLFEVVGSGARVSFAQMGPTDVNVGITF